MHNRRRMNLVRLNLYQPKILSVTTFVLLLLLKRMQPHHLFRVRRTTIHRLRNIVLQTSLSDLHHRFFPHSIDQHIGLGIHQNRGHQLIRPVVVMRQTTHRSLYAANHYRHIRKMLLQDAAISDRAIVRSCSGTSFRRISIIRSQSTRCRVVIDHRVHTSCRNSKVQTRTTQLSEITMITTPIRLRHYRHTKSGCLQRATDNRCTKLRMIHIRIASEEDDIHFIPAAEFHFLARGGQIFQ